MIVDYNSDSHEYTVDGRRVPSVTEICSLIMAQKYAEANIAMLDQAKRRGTEVHELCELIDYGADPEELEIAPELVGYVNAYLKFIRDYRPDWSMIEQIVCTTDFAGRIDRVGIIDGKLTIADIKTTSSMDRISKISLCCQLSGYREAITDGWADRIGIQLHKNGKYTVIRCYDVEVKYGFDSVDIWKKMKEIYKVIGGYNRT